MLWKGTFLPSMHQCTLSRAGLGFHNATLRYLPSPMSHPSALPCLPCWLSTIEHGWALALTSEAPDSRAALLQQLEESLARLLHPSFC